MNLKNYLKPEKRKILISVLLFVIARKLNDTSLCDKIDEGSLRESCIKGVEK
jgi:hypothetical protein